MFIILQNPKKKQIFVKAFNRTGNSDGSLRPLWKIECNGKNNAG